MRKDVIVLNPSSNIAVCTLWTKKEFVLESLPESVKEKVAIIGTLYTTLGVNYVLETLAEFNTVDTIIVYGADLSESGNAIVKTFAEKKVNDLKVDKSKAKVVVDTVKVIDLRNEAKKGNLEALIRAIEKITEKTLLQLEVS